MHYTHGVVSRRTDKRKRALNFAAHYSVGRRHAPSGRGKMCRRNQFGYRRHANVGALQIVNFRHAQAVFAYFRAVKQTFFCQLVARI